MQIKKTTRVWLAVAISGMALMTGCGQSGQAGGQQGEPLEVGVFPVQTEKLALTTELPGRTSAFLVSEVRPQVGGIILKRQFTEGADVKAGQPLYQIDPATYQAAYDSAKASLSKATANLTAANNKAERYNDLVTIKAVSQQDQDDAQAALKQALADVDTAKAALETARINLAYTKVAAPITGRIGKSAFTPGALVTASQATALTTVQQLDPIYVDVTQSSADLLRLKRDWASGKLKQAGVNQAAVQLVLEDGSKYALQGKLQFSDVTVDQGTGTITLRAIFPNPKGDLLPGMYVRAVLEEGETDAAILVPQQAITRDNKGTPMAMVINAEGKVEPRVLKTDRNIGSNWLVTEGLKAGDQVIMDNLQKIRPGMPVKAAAAPAATTTPTPATPAAKTADAATAAAKN